jgi:hypothetical protein
MALEGHSGESALAGVITANRTHPRAFWDRLKARPIFKAKIEERCHLWELLKDCRRMLAEMSNIG